MLNNLKNRKMKKKFLFLAMGLTLTTQKIKAQVPNYVSGNGLVGWYPFSGNTNDLSGNGLNGSPNNVIYNTDRFGNINSCFNVNGDTNRWVDVNISNPDIVNQQSKTFSFLLKLPVNYSSYWNHIITAAPSGIYTQIYGEYPTLASGFKNKLGFTSQNPISNFLFNDNLWHNVVVLCYDNSHMNLYIDGVLRGSQEFPTKDLTNINQIRIGNNGGNLSECAFAGQIDDVGIWNRALTEDEINNLYNANICYQNITVTDTLVINTGILSFNPVTYNNTVTIYPNPAKDHITIDCGNLANVTGCSIKIFNELGQEVFSAAMNTQQYSVPFNTWTGNGLYLVKIYDASNNVLNTKKIVLQ